VNIETQPEYSRWMLERSHWPCSNRTKQLACSPSDL